MKPVIGITCNFDWRLHQYCLAEAYVRSIEAAGGLALLLPCCFQEVPPQISNLLDGLLLSGGGDVDPAYYGEEPQCGLREIVPQRDSSEIAVTRWALHRELPLLAICRGLQILNIAAGGTIWQDIEGMYQSRLQHDQQAARSVISHTVFIAAESRLAEIYTESQSVKTAPLQQKLQCRVNSMHHQAIREVAPGFLQVATAADGIIEAIEKKDSRFAIGVQWHPECLTGENWFAQGLFREFIAACQ